MPTTHVFFFSICLILFLLTNILIIPKSTIEPYNEKLSKKVLLLLTISTIFIIENKKSVPNTTCNKILVILLLVMCSLYLIKTSFMTLTI